MYLIKYTCTYTSTYVLSANVLMKIHLHLYLVHAHLFQYIKGYVCSSVCVWNQQFYSGDHNTTLRLWAKNGKPIIFIHISVIIHFSIFKTEYGCFSFSKLTTITTTKWTDFPVTKSIINYTTKLYQQFPICFVRTKILPSAY